MLYLLLVATVLTASIVNRKQLSNYGSLLSVLLGLVLLFESFDYIIEKPERNILDHFYQPLEFTLLVIMYSKTLAYKWFNKYKLIYIIGFWVIAMYMSFAIEGLKTFNTLSFLLGSFLTIVMALLFQFQLFVKPSKEHLFTKPFFWINTAHLFFYLGTFIQMGLNSYIKANNEELADNLHTISYILNYVLYILYFVGITCKTIFRSY